MNFVQRKGTTAKAKYSEADFAKKKREFLDDLVTTVEMDEIPPELILNWDQTGINWFQQLVGQWTDKVPQRLNWWFK